MQEYFAVLGYDLGEENIERLRARFPQCSFYVHRKGEEAPGPDILAKAQIYCGYVLDGSLLPLMPKLAYMHTLNAGIDGIVGLLPERVQLSSGAGVYGVALGEHVMGLLLALLRGVHASVRNMAGAHDWRRMPILGSVENSRAAILGAGDIGSYVARCLKAMGAAHVAGYKLHPAPAKPPFDALHAGGEGLKACLAGADFVIVCLPGTPFTRHMIGDKAFAMMKEGSIFINIGRGTIVDTEALLRALESGRIRAAGLDVTEPEPLPPEHPLWDMENVILTPHYAGWSAGEEKLTDWFAENLAAFLAGETLPGAADRKWKY